MKQMEYSLTHPFCIYPSLTKKSKNKSSKTRQRWNITLMYTNNITRGYQDLVYRAATCGTLCNCFTYYYCQYVYTVVANIILCLISLVICVTYFVVKAHNNIEM